MRHTILAFMILVGCGDDSSGTDPLGGSVELTGMVRDLKTQQMVTMGTASVQMEGAVGQVMVDGTNFTVSGVPENSLVELVVAVPPTHHSTRNSIMFLTDNFTESAMVIDEETLTAIAAGAGTTVSPSTGMIIARLVDDSPAHLPKLGVAKGDLVLSATGGKGPVFLDAEFRVSTSTMSLAEGYVAYFDIPEGLPVLSSSPTAAVNMTAEIPVGKNVVTLVNVYVADGMAAPLPLNVSFNTQVFPIFQEATPGGVGRGCVACHSKSGTGKDLGGLTLGGGGAGQTNMVWSELVEERPNTRVNVASPALSKVLTMPSRESPPDRHPNVTFTGPSDPAYRLILAWITQGAKNN